MAEYIQTSRIVTKDRRAKKIRSSLLHWYRIHARDLPWRKTKDPYKIWVSEIMLQQTQVETVIPYYQRWIKKFPNVKRLADASSQDVMNHWAGLGYYRRARMLHEGAKKLLNECGGKLPGDVISLRKIPGIGRYTAGAIASIAFQKQEPLLDGNVIRVLTRLFAISSDISEKKTIDKLWELAERVVPSQQPGDFNQALMELGATVCVPENPRCSVCPLNSVCSAYLKNQPNRFPVKIKKDPLIQKRNYALILRKNGKVLIEKQPEAGRWGGLWMFPHSEKRPPLPRSLKPKLTVHHGFTKYRIQLDVFEYDMLSLRGAEGQNAAKQSLTCLPDRQGLLCFARNGTNRWIAAKNLKNFPFPSPHQKIVRHLTQNDA